MLVKEYANLVGVSTVAVTKRLKLNNPPKGVVSFKKIGNTYDLEVDLALLTNKKTKSDTKSKNYSAMNNPLFRLKNKVK